MNFANFSTLSRTAIQKAHALAVQNNNPQIEPSHMLVAMVQTDKDLIFFLLSQMGVERNGFCTDIGMTITANSAAPSTPPNFSATLQQVFEKAQTIAQQRNTNIVSLEHIFAACFEMDSPVRTVMRNHGITADKLKRALESRTTDGQRPTTADQQPTANDRPNLNTYAQNLNKLAEEGKIEPAIGRDEEIRRILQILTRKSKNNPILVGAPGTGKTAIVEGLAHRLLRGDVPEEMQAMKIYALDITLLIAGAGMQGELEKRLTKVIEEAKADPNIVLFIDEIHLLIGAGQGNGAMDAANILKPALARGEIKVIGATTNDEYRKYVESDKAFARRFQKVNIDEPDIDSAITIMRGIKSRYEKHHRIKILDEAVVAAVQLSHRYITDRFLPDKAIDLIDEAASMMRVEHRSVPHELDELTRVIRNKEMERESLIQDEQPHDLTALEQEIADLKEDEQRMYAKWQNERAQLEAIQKLREQKETLETQREAEQSIGHYTEAVALEHQIAVIDRSLEQQMSEVEQSTLLLKYALDENDIRHVVTLWTGIPVDKLSSDDSEKLLHLEQTLSASVKGQDQAVHAVSQAIRRNRMGFSDANKPIASFLFLGQTGVGKTELAKAIAEYLFNSRDMMVRIDMSEYQQEHSVARLFGAPPGYIGYDQGGQLTEAVRRKPYSVILLDEIEKAHNKVFETLLQVLDDGRMTDGQGNVVDFRNTIIVMTSNLGAGNVTDKNQLIAMLKQRISPEFVNRINDIILFQPLPLPVIQEIANMQCDALVKKMATRGLNITIDDEVVAKIAEIGYVPEFGARPVKRAIEDNIVNNLTMALLTGQLKRELPIHITLTDTGFRFQNQ